MMNKILKDPTLEELRGCIRDGYCWWCNKGGWKNLALHTYHAHGINAAELKELAFLYKHDPTCSHEFSDKIRNVAKKNHYHHNLIDKNYAPHRIMSPAGKAQRNRMREETKSKRAITLSKTRQRLFAEGKLNNNNPAHPHACRICGAMIPTARPRLCSKECRAKAWQEAQVKARTNRRKKITESDKSIIRNRFQKGESSAKIASEYNISPRYVRLIGKR